MVPILLKLARLFGPIVSGLGGDVAQFLAILETKLTLDSRRPMTGFANRREKESGGFTAAMVIYGLIGCLLAGTLWRVGSPFVGMLLVHTTVLLMLTMTLIADFTNVLLDTTDNAILQPRPVSGRTLFLARVAHVSIYLGSLGLSLSVIPMIVGTIRWSFFFPLIYLVTFAGTLMVTISLSSLFYLVALRLTTRERIRDVVLYVQIIFTVMVLGGLQLMPRLPILKNIEYARFHPQAWMFFCPPAWLAAPIDLVCSQVDAPRVLLSTLGLVIIPLAMLLIARGLTGRFNQMLSAMEGGAERTTGAGVQRPWGVRLAPLVGRSRVRQCMFEWIWTMLSRDRLFKQRTYPSIAMFFIVSTAMVLTQRQNPAGTAHYHLVLLYFAAASFSPAIMQIRYSAQWQAAWVYESMPIPHASDILLPALAALLLRLVIPVFAVAGTIFMVLWGAHIWPDVVLALLVMIGLSLLQMIIVGRHLPFSEQPGVREGSGRMGKNLGMIAVAAALGWMHYQLLNVPYGVPVAILALAIVVTAIWMRPPLQNRPVNSPATAE